MQYVLCFVSTRKLEQNNIAGSSPRLHINNKFLAAPNDLMCSSLPNFMETPLCQLLRRLPLYILLPHSYFCLMWKRGRVGCEGWVSLSLVRGYSGSSNTDCIFWCRLPQSANIVSLPCKVFLEGYCYLLLQVTVTL